MIKTISKKDTISTEFKLKQQRTFSFKLIFIVLAIIYVLAVISLIFSTPYKYDFKLSQFFEKGLKFEIVKYWSMWYQILGDTEIVVVYLSVFMILVESFFAYKTKDNKLNFWSKNKWILKSIYVLIIIIWLIQITLRCNSIINKDNGFGNNADAVLLDSNIYRNSGMIIFSAIHTILLITVFCWIHFKLARTKEFLTDKYWIDALKVLIIAIFSSITVILKGMTSRPFYYNVIYNDLLEQVRLNKHSDWVDHYLNQDVFKHGFLDIKTNKYIANSTTDWPWYVSNGFFNPSKYTNQFSSWQDWAFPSGHVCMSLALGNVLYLFITKNNKITYKKLIVLGIYLLHLFSMGFALVVNRGHWVSDIAFSYVYFIPIIVLVNIYAKRVILKIVELVNKKFSKKKGW
ncbi:phosphatase PAP2 family protein [Mycoplasma feriruminatoris]|uniref:Phosphatase PAP2 family protein n=1 Tax=Mycoplasma feriruminatoris TaxID=1179777 RepID=A0ABY8HYJ6_9MOLU|nr:phosphatase PAP2 family protein [Mycoplasma feriruminatoris]WFQ93941.1 phosphatase PAP2 family protein [Mycoplasma feriruminatoris]